MTLAYQVSRPVLSFTITALTGIIRERNIKPEDFNDAFEAIWDEVESGQNTYGNPTLFWVKFIRSQQGESDYWYKRIRTKVHLRLQIYWKTQPNENANRLH